MSDEEERLKNTRKLFEGLHGIIHHTTRYYGTEDCIVEDNGGFDIKLHLSPKLYKAFVSNSLIKGN